MRNDGAATQTPLYVSGLMSSQAVKYLVCVYFAALNRHFQKWLRTFASLSQQSVMAAFTRMHAAVPGALHSNFSG